MSDPSRDHWTCTGTVVATAGGRAEIVLDADRCPGCTGACGWRERSRSLMVAGDARPGDRLRIDLSRSHLRRVAVGLFGGPLLGLLGGIALGTLLDVRWATAETFSTLFGVIGTATGAGLGVWWTRRARGGAYVMAGKVREPD